MLNKLKGGVAPFMMGMVLAIGTVSTITAKQYQAENEKRKEEYINAKKRHIERLNKDMRGSFHKQNDHSKSQVNLSKSREAVYTNIFSQDAVNVKRKTRGSTGDKRTIINIDSNEYNKERYRLSLSSNIRKRDIDISSGTIFDEQNVRQEQILKSYSNMQSLAKQIYNDIAAAPNKVFSCNLPSGYKDAWGRDFTYTKVADNTAQLSFNLPWNTSKTKVLEMKVPELPKKTGGPFRGSIPKSVHGTNVTTVILTENGELWGTGQNTNGELGLGDRTNRTTWTYMNLDNVVAFDSATTAMAALKADGTLWATGRAYSGIYGLNNSYTTTWKKAADNVKEFYGNWDNAYIIKNDGTAYFTGENDNGELGNGTTIKSASWVPFPKGPVKSVTTRSNSSFVTTEDGKFWVTGKNDSGQLGLGDKVDRLTWVDSGLRDVIATQHMGSSSRGYGTIALTADGKVYVTGDNTWRHLGIGDVDEVTSWTETSLSNIKSLHADSYYVLYALSHTGDLYLAGRHKDTTYNTWYKETDVSNIETLYTEGGLMLFAKEYDGTLWDASRYYSGRLSLQTTDTTVRNQWHKTPIPKIKHFNLSQQAGLAITLDNKLWGGGRNNYYFGTGGPGVGPDSKTWQELPLTDIDFYYQPYRTGFEPMIIKHDNTVWTLGYNSYGERGGGDSTPLKERTLYWTEVVGPNSMFLERDAGGSEPTCP